MLTFGTRALFSSFTVESISFWIGIEIFTCYLGLSDFDLSMPSDCSATVDCDSSVVGHRKVLVKMQRARQLQSRADLRGADVERSFGKMKLMLRE
ncbi:hypothetical protein Q3G72_001092 [Acer saccharum]|nr:hypothetical protein Q3G72_001092 [Acer saccharum]